MIEKNYKVTSNEGLHARPSSVLVSAVTPFTVRCETCVYGKDSELEIDYGCYGTWNFSWS